MFERGVLSATSLFEERLEQERQKWINEAKPKGKLKKGCLVHTAFSNYLIEEQIGSGGNGRVFSGTDEENNKFALKFVPSGESKTKLKRLKNEIHFCETIEHPNIIKILDHGFAEFEDGSYSFYVMPLYKETLRTKMRGIMPPDNILFIISGILSGLSFAHKRGTVHRDIKPENILFAPGNIEPVICDFGIAHFSENDLITAVETRRTERLANFQYAAPEQRVKGAEVGVTADLYAVGLILNEMFTGEIPQAADYKTITEVNPNYDYLDIVFQQLYRQNPADRIQTANEVLTELEVLAKQKSHALEADRIQKQIKAINAPAELNLEVINISFEDGILRFEMSAFVPREWMGIIKNQEFTHTSVVGYEKTKLFQYSENGIGMPLKGQESDDLIRRIINNFKDWVTTVNGDYNRTQKIRIDMEIQEAERKRQTELNKIAEAKRINSLLSKL